MDIRHRKLDTFPSTYSKDFIFYDKYERAKKCGTYEPFELSSEDKKLFRPLYLDSYVENELGIEGLKDFKIVDPDPGHMKTIYQSDYANGLETMRKMFDPDLMDDMEDPFDEPLSLVKSGKPVEPLISALRVCPGIPRYYKTCKSEYQSTIDKLGKTVIKNLKHTLESETDAEPKLIEQCK